MAKFQIRHGPHGVALYDADDAREALLDFFADRAKSDLRADVELAGEGPASYATVQVDGSVYAAVGPDVGATGPAG